MKMKVFSWLAAVALLVTAACVFAPRGRKAAPAGSVPAETAQISAAPEPGVALQGWMTDLDAAMVLAKNQHKSVLIEFTGSDFCPPCVVMRKHVFSKKEFIGPAGKNFILVELDLPLSDKALAARNQIHAIKYGIDALPTVVLLNSEGKEYSRFFAAEHTGIDDFLAVLDQKLKLNPGLN